MAMKTDLNSSVIPLKDVLISEIYHRGRLSLDVQYFIIGYFLNQKDDKLWEQTNLNVAKYEDILWCGLLPTIQRIFLD